MYDLHTLGWASFQQLCLAVAQEVLGQTVQSYLDTKDGGRDGAFTGVWRQQGSESLRGRFVIQCKHTSKRNHSLQLSELTDELAKVRRLVARELCDIYVLLTNAQVSGTRAEEIQILFQGIGVKEVVVLGSTWVSQKIRESKRLRMMVPRLYGLGDLSQILDERAYAQARAILESLRDELSKVVITDAYRRAAAALDTNGYVLLLGEPAAGKTTIASMLATTAVDQWDASMIKLDSASSLVEHWNPLEPSQFFWIDDAFGVTQYEESQVLGWNRILPQVRTILNRGGRIVMTSRDYIYNQARRKLKTGAFPLLNESQVVIDVQELSLDEKRQILYNHLRLGNQPVDFRRRIKPKLEAIAEHKSFVPEIARRLADPLFTSELTLTDSELHRFVEKREQFLREVLLGLDEHSKAALAVIYMRNDQLRSPIELQETERLAVDRLGSSLGGCVAALEALRGSLVVNIQANGESVWRFKHPTIGEAYASILTESSELLAIYVQGSPVEKLCQQVSCGDVGIERAVVLPRSLYGLALERISDFDSSANHKSAWLKSWSARSTVRRFLARRCSKEFLLLYIERDQGLLTELGKPGLMLSAVPEVSLAVRLHELDLLPEEIRQAFAKTVFGYAVRGDDLYALEDRGVRSLLTSPERHELQEQVQAQLLPNLSELRRDLQGDFDPATAPAEEHMQSFLDSLRVLERHFGNDADSAIILAKESRYAQEWIAENASECVDVPSRPLSIHDQSEGLRGRRSIFDDIDS